MLLTGLHSAYTEAESRRRSFMWHGVPPATDLTIFNERSWHAPYAAIGLRITGSGGAGIRAGLKGYRSVPFDCVLMGTHVVADAAGSIEFDVYRSSGATSVPGPSDTITPLQIGRPQLASAQMRLDMALFGWSKKLSKGERLGFNVISVNGLNTVTLTLLVAPNDRL